jgi:hypothetical protein
MAATYSPALWCSTIGHGGLNFSVRNGKRWRHPRQDHHKVLTDTGSMIDVLLFNGYNGPMNTNLSLHAHGSYEFG